MKKVLFIALLISFGFSHELDEKLIKSCTSCHGVNFDKAPLGKRMHIITKHNKNAEDIMKKLKHYKTLKGHHGQIMREQVKNLSDEEIEEIAEYIEEIILKGGEKSKKE